MSEMMKTANQRICARAADEFAEEGEEVVWKFISKSSINTYKSEKTGDLSGCSMVAVLKTCNE